MRHESEYPHSRKHKKERYLDSNEEIPEVRHKRKKHKRHREYEEDERQEERDAVVIHGSSSDEAHAEEEPQEDVTQTSRNSHRRKHRRHCSGHRKRHKERQVYDTDSEDERKVQIKIERDIVDAADRVKSEPKPESSSGPSRKSRFEPKPGVEQWGQKGTNSTNTKPGEKEKPNFGLSGKLAEDTNMCNGIVVKYSEPPEARKPKRRWRLYPFKGEEALKPLYIHRQSAYLLGRERKVADIPIDHPSCSKQHAALQYRLVPFKRANGSMGKQIKLYIIDLESANGTFVNNKKIEGKKYMELLERDVIKFGFSSREYVLLHEHSKDDDDDDDDDDVRINND